MKINTYDIGKFLYNPLSLSNSALIYGPNYGLVKNRAKQIEQAIIKPGNEFNKYLFHYENIKEQIHLVQEAIFSFSLYGTAQKLIIINDFSASINEQFKNIIINLPQTCFLLILSEDLPPSSSLRKFYEKEKNILSIPCYKEDNLSIKKIVDNMCSQHNIRYDPKIIGFLAEYTNGHTMIIENELKKLILLKSNDIISLEDIKLAILSPIESSIEELCYQVGLGRLKEAIIINQKLLSENIAVITLIRSLVRHFFRIYLAKSFIKQGVTESQAMAKLAPPIFFKNIPQFSLQIKRYSDKYIENLIVELNNIESKYKHGEFKTITPYENLLIRIINHEFASV